MNFLDDTSIFSEEDRNFLVRPYLSSITFMKCRIETVVVTELLSILVLTNPNSFNLVSVHFASNSFNQHERKIHD